MGRAQLSIIVIIGIVVLVIGSLVFIKVNSDRIDVIRRPLDEDSQKINVVKSYMDGCLKRSAAESIQKLGTQGLLSPDAYLASEDRMIKIAYFYAGGQSYFPKDLSIIESQLASEIEITSRECIEDFSVKGYVIEELGGLPNVTAKFGQEYVNLTMVYPIKIYYEGGEASLESFKAELKFNFFNIYRVSEKIYLETKENPQWINFEILKGEPFEIKLVRIDKETLVYEITDSKYGLEDKPYKYRFAVKYDF